MAVWVSLHCAGRVVLVILCHSSWLAYPRDPRCSQCVCVSPSGAAVTNQEPSGLGITEFYTHCLQAGVQIAHAGFDAALVAPSHDRWHHRTGVQARGRVWEARGPTASTISGPPTMLHVFSIHHLPALSPWGPVSNNLGQLKLHPATLGATHGVLGESLLGGSSPNFISSFSSSQIQRDPLLVLTSRRMESQKGLGKWRQHGC